MQIGVPKETFLGECRVALAPISVALLKKAGLDVEIERGAGETAGFPDLAQVLCGRRCGKRSA